MDVNPKTLSFFGLVPERSVEITNRGNNDLTFSVDGLPEAFDPRPPSGNIPHGESRSVSILRTILPPPSKSSITFHVRTNLQDDQEVEIVFDSRNAVLWQDLGDQLRHTSGTDAPTLDGALGLLSKSLGQSSKVAKADRYVLASRVLLYGKSDAEVLKAMDGAGKLDPSIWRDPSNLLQLGLVAARGNQPDRAIRYFTEARAATPADSSAQSIADLLSGGVLLEQGNTVAAGKLLNRPDVRRTVADNPSLLPFAEYHLCPGKNDACALSFRGEFSNN